MCSAFRRRARRRCLLGGLLIVGLQTGPLLFATNPDFVWTVFGSFWLGNLMLVALTVVMIPFLAAIIFVPTAILYPAVIGIVTFGVYTINYAMSESRSRSSPAPWAS